MSSQEFELKFGIPAERLPALKKALGRGKLRSERLRAVYFDSEDALLAKARIALRLRKEGRTWVQTLKTSAEGDALRRLEHNVRIVAAAGGNGAAVPVLDLSRHDDTPAADALRAALKGSGRRDDSAAAVLQAHFEVDVRRSARLVRHAGAGIEIALDIGRIAAGGLHSQVCELELELKTGAEAALFALAERWQAAHGLWLASASKAERGSRLARGERAAGVVKARPLEMSEPLSTADFVRAATRNCLDQIVANASVLAGGFGTDDDAQDEDAGGKSVEKAVHQLRVGIRRLRSLLRDMKDAVPHIDARWEPALRDTFQALGAYRDHAVVMPQWSEALEAAGAPIIAAPTPPKAAERDLQALVRDPGFQRTLLELLGFATLATRAVTTAPTDSTGMIHATPGETDARQVVAMQLQRLHHQLARDAKRFDKLTADHQHRARKRLKRLRYLSELAASFFKEKEVRRYLGAMREAQDALGALNDEHTAAESFRRDAEQHPHAWFAVGWLAARHAASVERSRKALGRVADARRFWTK